MEPLDLSSPLKKASTEGTSQTKLVGKEKQKNKGVIGYSSHMNRDELENIFKDSSNENPSEKGADNLSSHEREGIGRNGMEWERIVESGPKWAERDESGQQLEGMAKSDMEGEIMEENGKKFTSKRRNFPFDKEDEEDYVSEYEEGDTEEYTKKRRNIKDKLELELQKIDHSNTKEYEGDDEIIRKFRNHMSKTSTSGSTKGEFEKLHEPSTVLMYTRAIEKDVLKAFHTLFTPFNSSWLLDCTTEKKCNSIVKKDKL